MHCLDLTGEEAGPLFDPYAEIKEFPLKNSEVTPAQAARALRLLADGHSVKDAWMIAATPWLSKAAA